VPVAGANLKPNITGPGVVALVPSISSLFPGARPWRANLRSRRKATLILRSRRPSST